MVRRSSSRTLCFAACVVMMALLAGCGGNLAPAATATLPVQATSTLSVPTVLAETATTAPTEVVATPTLEASTPTTEAEATSTTEAPTQIIEVPEAPTETAEAPQETPASTQEPAMEGTPVIAPSEAERTIKERAAEAIEALRGKDMERLAELVHPEKGLGFAPYTYIDETNRHMTREEVAGALSDRAPRHWGSFDGTGDDIDLTFEAYYDRFVYNHDFAAAPNISYNEFKGHGNTYNNVFVVYPNAIVVEYHFPGFDPQYDGMDWNALYLVFEKHTDGSWYLVHITHGQWTI